MSSSRPRPGIWVFDCDGVLLDSNGVKTQAFREVAMRYGVEIADEVVRHHLEHGGISRHVKLRRIFDELLHRPDEPGEFDELLRRFATASRRGLESAAVEPDAAALLAELADAGHVLHVVSGGLEEEVRWVLDRKRLGKYFTSVRGSPTTKWQHVDDLVAHRSAASPAVLVGDSREDLRVALEHGLTAVFVSQWSEFHDWSQYVHSHPSIVHVENLGELQSRLVGGCLP